MERPADLAIDQSYPPFITLRDEFGFVPNLFRAQSPLHRAIEAEVAIFQSVLFTQRALSRVQKECILMVGAAAQRDVYTATLHYQVLRLLGVPEEKLDRILEDHRRAGMTPQNVAMLDLAVKLGWDGAPVSREDLAGLSAHGFPDEAILEVVLCAALAGSLAELTARLSVAPDFAPRRISPRAIPAPSGVPDHNGPYLRTIERTAKDFPPFAFFVDCLGYVPGVFRAQTLRPDVIEAQAVAFQNIVVSQGGLSRAQKERILQGATDEPGLEAAPTAWLARFLSTLTSGLGAKPDLVLPKKSRPVAPEKVHLSGDEPRHIDVTLRPDPDAEWVGRVQGGDLDAFEELMNRHSQRVYRTLVGILGNPEEARDALQDTFLKAFQNLARFEGRAKFSTWLVSIASNTAIQRLRERRSAESLDDAGVDPEEGFRPRQVQAWTDNPEQIYSQAELRALIQNSVMRLPAKYRVVLMLRDIEQLPVEDAAAALDLGIPAFKARLLRGRLMLREALAPHFTSTQARGVTL